MARHDGREVATPVVMGDQLDPPTYGELWSEAASRVFFASYREYEQRVKFANAEGVVRRQLMSVSQLICVCATVLRPALLPAKGVDCRGVAECA